MQVQRDVLRAPQAARAVGPRAGGLSRRRHLPESLGRRQDRGGDGGHPADQLLGIRAAEQTGRATVDAVNGGTRL